MKIQKKSKNPYLNLIKNLRRVHRESSLSVYQKLENFYQIFTFLEADLRQYKFYTHPSFNNKWYGEKCSENLTNHLNLKNPWHLFFYNFKKIINSHFLNDGIKFNTISKELGWFYNTYRVHDWVERK